MQDVRHALMSRAVQAAILGAGTLLATPSRAVDAPIVWTGEFKVITESASCGGHWPPGTQFLGATYRPKFSSSFAAFVVAHHRGAVMYYNSTPMMQGKGTYTAFGITKYATSAGNGGNWSSTYSFKISPATVTPTTKFVTIEGSIDDFRNVPGCKITFRSGLTLDVQ